MSTLTAPPPRARGTGPAGSGNPPADRHHLARLGADLEPITLAELAEGSDLQTRVDQKYLVPLSVLDVLVETLGPDLRVLEIDGRRVFGYESIYFDTPDLRLFRDHAQGRRIRHKVRTRLYADSGLTMLEVKAKGGRGETVKHRLDWQREDLLRIHSGGREFVGSHLAGRPQVEDLRPVLRSRYRRMTLVHAAGGLRITCDADLEFEGPGDGTVVIPPGRVLLETKSEAGRSAADRLLRSCGQRDVLVSKYCAGVALTTGVRANRWHRTLRRYLTTP
ncbi:MAG: polyphosphate polymerase domain-containing protein [Intrasporangium sp.]|uniref:polyphosphate polymerase domain-containing protein n=1 Tax=Intrasporangium sp. TaxID=1925024 RepID=UPI002648F473|nr:polyphosphate polymerase domain-containing protein [Intrasporangium sp.]MDN5795689.1 polyphosphate polymerase domain-containing protein [Intrasporangium sp.]